MHPKKPPAARSESGRHGRSCYSAARADSLTPHPRSRPRDHHLGCAAKGAIRVDDRDHIHSRSGNQQHSPRVTKIPGRIVCNAATYARRTVIAETEICVRAALVPVIIDGPCDWVNTVVEP